MKKKRKTRWCYHYKYYDKGQKKQRKAFRRFMSNPLKAN